MWTFVFLRDVRPQADVVTENFRPYVMDSLGLGYEGFWKKHNPKIIMASNSGFGDRGDWAARPSYDGIAQAFNGVMTGNAGGPSHEPKMLDWSFSDEVGARNEYFRPALSGMIGSRASRVGVAPG